MLGDRSCICSARLCRNVARSAHTASRPRVGVGLIAMRFDPSAETISRTELWAPSPMETMPTTAATNDDSEHREKERSLLS